MAKEPTFNFGANVKPKAKKGGKKAAKKGGKKSDAWKAYTGGGSSFKIPD